LTELEKIGLIPRSIVRMLDRFYYQIYLGTAEPLVKQFRFSKYLLLTSVKSLFVVLFIPFFINILTKIYIFRPLVEYFWDTKQTEIFLNYELQEKAFTEIRNFEEKIYFDHLLKISEERRDEWETERTTSFLSTSFSVDPALNLGIVSRFDVVEPSPNSEKALNLNFVAFGNQPTSRTGTIIEMEGYSLLNQSFPGLSSFSRYNSDNDFLLSSVERNSNFSSGLIDPFDHNNIFLNSYDSTDMGMFGKSDKSEMLKSAATLELKQFQERPPLIWIRGGEDEKECLSSRSVEVASFPEKRETTFLFSSFVYRPTAQNLGIVSRFDYVEPSPNSEKATFSQPLLTSLSEKEKNGFKVAENDGGEKERSPFSQSSFSLRAEQEKGLLQSPFSPIFRQKTRELAEHYNKESISALTNLLADFMGLFILLILLVNMKMSLMNTTAFLSESFFSLKDSKKAFLMLLFTDLLVGFHSPRGWEVIFHFLFEHFGLPENHNIIFLLVGTFPVLLDALFKYWIFRHLNRHSPATVATFQAMVE